jgi:transposase-like protein
MRKHYTESQRAELIALVAHGEATPRAAAARLGVAESTAYYWLKRRGRRPVALAVADARPRPGPVADARPRARPVAAPAFARLVPATQASAALTVRVGDAAIAVAHDFDAELLRAVVAALAGRAP